MGCMQRIRFYVNSLIHSFFYLGYHIVLVIVSAALVIWGVVDLVATRTAPFISLEIVITGSLFFDVILLFIGKGRRVLKSWRFYFDCFVILLSALLLLSYLWAKQGPWVFSINVVLLREVVIIARLISFLMRMRSYGPTRGEITIESAPLLHNPLLALSTPEIAHAPPPRGAPPSKGRTPRMVPHTLGPSQAAALDFSEAGIGALVPRSWRSELSIDDLINKKAGSEPTNNGNH
ncbi:hypothetical protein PAPYR_219 [Paratrimastix pyriformis]|uniref:Ion transport domain-containing protein n=1 Tax=Paratrimastix pyriformis TaxID=342808 RepID=A0ABQ8UV59_9EUKA|nr:hypothetical protein PAPYR_219 [Paratrimastix pyriformis]